MSPSKPRRTTAEAFCHYRRTGDSKALTEVFDRTAPELLALASHLSGGLVEAEDLVQHTFLIAIEKAKRFKEGRELLPWLAGILIREAQKQRRKRSRRVDPERLPAREAPEGERVALNGELHIAVTRALSELPLRYQSVLRPFLLEGRTASEIAGLNASAPGTVRVQLHRGLDLLRRALPTGIGLGLVGASIPRGLGSVRLAVEASASAAPITAASTATLVPLTVAMMAKTTILAATLVAVAFCLTLVERDSPLPESLEPEVVESAESPARIPPRPPAPAATNKQRVSLVSETEPQSEPSNAQVAPPTTEAPEPSHALLRGNMDALQLSEPAEFELELRAGSSHEHTLLHKVEGSGPFHLDLDPLLAEGNPKELRILVIARSSLFQTASAYAEFSGTEGSTAVYEVTLSPGFIEFTIHGKLIPVAGRPLQDPRVTMMIEDPESPTEFWKVELGTVRENGEFTIRLPHRELGVLYCWAENSGVSRIEIPHSTERVITLDPIPLNSAAAIRGVATRENEPLPEGSTVFAMLEERPTPFSYSYAGMVLDGGAIAFRARSGRVGKGGVFSVDGLEAGLEYILVAVPFGSVTQYRKRFDAGAKIEAPAWNVALDWGLKRVQLQVRHAAQPVENAQAMLVPPKLNSSLGMEGIHGGEWLTPIKARPSGVIEVLIPVGPVTEFDIEAPGYETQRLALDGSALPKDGIVTVELDRGEASASLSLNVTVGDAAVPNGTLILLTRMDARERLEYLGPVAVTNGIANFPELPPGIQQVYASVQASPSIPYDSIPLVNPGNMDLRFAALEPGEERTESLRLMSTGMIEVRVTGRDSARAAPVFELEAEGQTQSPEYVFATEFGNATSAEFQGSGPCALERSLIPGNYVVRLLEGDYEAEEREVVVRAGERTSVTFDLRVRY